VGSGEVHSRESGSQLSTLHYALATATILSGLALAGCTGNLRQELDQMALVRPTPAALAPLRAHVEETFRCPEGAQFAYFLGELDLATNVTRIGIRCQ
jgi:hypothetical protein